MIVFPNAKINLGLHVLRKRADGYHDLETVFYPIPLKDILELVLVDKPDNATSGQTISFQTISVSLKSGKQVHFSSSGIPIDGTAEHNLCIKACEIFDSEAKLPGNIKIHLHKQIPMGAGLGGGSSDAAFVLKILNQLSNNPFTDKQLIELAGRIGSDCPFFVINKPVLATGKGEIMTPINLDLTGYKIIVLKSAVHVSTHDAFSAIQPFENRSSLTHLVDQEPNSWQGKLTNDFEAAIFPKYPEIEKIKRKLIEKGALYASMTGSGSAVFGIFDSETSVKEEFDNLYYFSSKLEY